MIPALKDFGTQAVQQASWLLRGACFFGQDLESYSSAFIENTGTAIE